ncbi:MAG: hypothetical protein ABIR34_09685, partial [Marmoricola sp.]
ADELTAEENNLADVLRRALADDETASAVRLLATLGTFWAITGNHPRVFALAETAERMLERWEPPPELVPATQEAFGILLSHLGILQNRAIDALASGMRRLGVPTEPWARAAYAMFVEAESEGQRSEVMLAMGEDPDPATAMMGLQWAAVLAENDGDIEAATSYARRALDSADEATTPWQRASLHTSLALFAMHVGEHHASIEHAELRWPLLTRLHAHDDALQVRASMAVAALAAGDLAECERILDEVEDGRHGQTFGGQMIETAARAELALESDALEQGLRLYAGAVESMRDVRFAGVEPTGLEAWALVAEALALMAHARHARSPAEIAVRDDLAVLTLGKSVDVMELHPTHLDFPVTGMSLAALAQWLFTTGDAPLRQEGIGLLALARRFSYNRSYPVMAWELLVRAADEVEPGRLAALLEEYADRPGRDLLGEAITAVRRVGALVDRTTGDPR